MFRNPPDLIDQTIERLCEFRGYSSPTKHYDGKCSFTTELGSRLGKRTVKTAERYLLYTVPSTSDNTMPNGMATTGLSEEVGHAFVVILTHDEEHFNNNIFASSVFLYDKFYDLFPKAIEEVDLALPGGVIKKVPRARVTICTDVSFQTSNSQTNMARFYRDIFPVPYRVISISDILPFLFADMITHDYTLSPHTSPHFEWKDLKIQIPSVYSDDVAAIALDGYPGDVIEYKLIVEDPAPVLQCAIMRIIPASSQTDGILFLDSQINFNFERVGVR